MDDGEREALEAAREAKYREIRDLELDFRTGKLSSEDYEATNAQLRSEAIQILDRLEREEGEGAGSEGERAGSEGEGAGSEGEGVRPEDEGVGRGRGRGARPGGRRRQAQGRLSSTIAFTKNRTANRTVQRLRLRSTIDPPPRGPAPVPTPKAPERPASLPECIRISSTSTTEMATWMMESIVSTIR